MPVRLIDSLATTAPLAELFSDQSVLAAMLAFESALARAEARLGIVPQPAAEKIGAIAQAVRFDGAAIAEEAFRSGTPAIPLVKELTARVRSQDAAAAGFVHWGATSQDLCDTAMVLLLKKAQKILRGALVRLQSVLRKLAETHANTVMLSRTLLQAAPPTTFGLKTAGWLAAIRRTDERLSAAFKECVVLQFGGACGTLAALGKKGIAVGQAMAEELGLRFPDAPWHTHRDRLAALVCACGVLVGSLGKMARDISLLTQTEIGELAEPAGERGRSSAMPHKLNPVGCTLALALAARTPALVSSFLSAMVQEHERAVGGWQAEWPIVAEVIQGTGAALAAMVEVVEGLSVDPARMRVNLEATRGIIFAERAMIALAQHVGRDAAHKLVEDAVRRSREDGRKLSETLAEMKEVATHLDAATLRDLERPEQYLGAAEEFRKRLLASAAGEKPEGEE